MKNKAIKEAEKEEMHRLRAEKQKEFEIYLKQKDEEYARQKNDRKQILGEASEDEAPILPMSLLTLT